MDQRGDGSRAFHRVRQPDVQWHLRRLSNCAAKEQQRDGTAEDESTRRRARGQLGQVDGVIEPIAHHDPEQESEVADAV